MKIRNWLVLAAPVVAMMVMLAGCGLPGTSYLALSYSTVAPSDLWFPELPDPLDYDTYYEHPAGTYYGEYTNIVFYDFWYTIEEKRGVFFGSIGDDRYYTMMLDSSGPWMYYEDYAASLAGKGSKAAVPKGSAANASIDRSLYDLDHPEPFSWEKSMNGVTFKVTGNRYRLK